MLNEDVTGIAENFDGLTKEVVKLDTNFKKVKKRSN